MILKLSKTKKNGNQPRRNKHRKSLGQKLNPRRKHRDVILNPIAKPNFGGCDKTSPRCNIKDKARDIHDLIGYIGIVEQFRSGAAAIDRVMPCHE